MFASRSDKLSFRQLFPALLVLLAMVSFAGADVVISHTGQNDPVDEGWTYEGDGPFWDTLI